MGNTFCSYFTQDIKQILLKVEQGWSTWCLFFGVFFLDLLRLKKKKKDANNRVRVPCQVFCVNDA